MTNLQNIPVTIFAQHIFPKLNPQELYNLSCVSKYFSSMVKENLDIYLKELESKTLIYDFDCMVDDGLYVPFLIKKIKLHQHVNFFLGTFIDNGIKKSIYPDKFIFEGKIYPIDGHLQCYGSCKISYDSGCYSSEVVCKFKVSSLLWSFQETILFIVVFSGKYALYFGLFNPLYFCLFKKNMPFILVFSKKYALYFGSFRKTSYLFWSVQRNILFILSRSERNILFFIYLIKYHVKLNILV